MKRTLRAGLCLILALAAALPASAQTTTLAFPAIPRAQKGETVTVCLKDGREITGVVGKWVDAVGFYVKPADSAAYLIHPEDVVVVTDTSSHAMRLIPQLDRSSGINGAAVAGWAAFGVIMGVVLLRVLFAAAR